MSAVEPAPAVGPDDFRALEFDRLWSGRERTTELERAILDDLLLGVRRTSFLEVGCGAGRLTPGFESGTDRFTGVDLDPRFLAVAKTRVRPRPGVRFVAANLYHLPITSGSVDTAALVRVYNFLSRPAVALREIRRVLRPGGSLVVSCNPRPSPQSLLGDVRAGLHPVPGAGTSSMTFSRAEVVPVRPSPIPAYAPTRGAFEATLAAAGFRVERRFGSGLEDSRWTRSIPLERFRDWGRHRPRSTLHSMIWELARTELFDRIDTAPSRPATSADLACPRCQTPMDGAGGGSATRLICPHCSWEIPVRDGILDARFFPEAAEDGATPAAASRR